MERRHFIKISGTTSAMLSGGLPLWAIGEKRDGTNYGTGSESGKITSIGKWSLQEIRDIFFEEFYKNNLPLWRNHVIDQSYGGYIPHTGSYINGAGELIQSDKRMYHQGRCFWFYSYLYNHVEKDLFYLDAAKQGYEFLVKNALDEKSSLWWQRVNRQGVKLIPPRDILASVYMFMGLGEYYKACGEAEVADLALETAHAINRELTSNAFQAPGMGPRAEFVESWREPGTRRLGFWIHFLSALTPFLKYRSDHSLEMIARFCVRNILERHYQKDLRFAFEFLQFDYSPYPSASLSHETMRAVDGFHSVEASWMCMDEALRTGDRPMFEKALHLGKDVMDLLWLERGGKQGLVRYYWPDDPDPMGRANILSPYVMNEVWVMLLLGMEHSSETWLVEWFDKSFTYAYRTGKILFPYGETLHHPRGLLFSLEILDRMIARGGVRSDFLESSSQANEIRNYR